MWPFIWNLFCNGPNSGWSNKLLSNLQIGNLLGISVLDNETAAWSSLGAHWLFNSKIGLILRNIPYLKATRQTTLAPADAHAQKVPLPPWFSCSPAVYFHTVGSIPRADEKSPLDDSLNLWSLTNVCWPSHWLKTGHREQFFRSHKNIWTFKFRFILHCSTGFAFVDTAAGQLT